jgi:predicted nucleotidyltransferase
MDDILESIFSESSIDFPQKDLDLNVWDKKDNLYTIVPEVKRKILDVIGKYPDVDLIDAAAGGEPSPAATIHIVGSICSNQYTLDADIDVHIVISEDADFYGDIDFQKKVIKWFNDNRESIDGFIGKHPIEVYPQYDKKQDMMSVGVYDLLADEWLVGPKKVPEDYDPYEDFSHIADDLRDVVEDADKLFGELKRDVIDYGVIVQAMNQLSVEQKELFLERLGRKLEEIEDDIDSLYSKRKEWIAARKKASKPSSPEEAADDIELAKQWNDQNAIFKFVNRYNYLKIISDLKDLLKDNKLTPREVDKIQGIMGA